MNLDPFLTSSIKLTQNKILNARAKTIKFWHENISINLKECELGNGFLDMKEKHKKKKGIIYRPSKFKTFLFLGTLSRKWKDNLRVKENMYKSYI